MRTRSTNIGVYRREVLKDHPVAYWPLGNASVSVDSLDAVNGIALTHNSGVNANRAGALIGDTNRAMFWSGSGANSNASNASLNLSTFCVEIWAYSRSTNSEMDILGNNTATKGYIIDHESGIWKWYSYNGSGSNAAITGPAVKLNTWQHLVGGYDGTNHFFYVDGVLIGSAAVTYSANGNNATIGRSSATADFIADEFAVYPRVLTASRIRAHIAAARGLMPVRRTWNPASGRLLALRRKAVAA